MLLHPNTVLVPKKKVTLETQWANTLRNTGIFLWAVPVCCFLPWSSSFITQNGSVSHPVTSHLPLLLPSLLTNYSLIPHTQTHLYPLSADASGSKIRQQQPWLMCGCNMADSDHWILYQPASWACAFLCVPVSVFNVGSKICGWCGAEADQTS